MIGGILGALSGIAKPIAKVIDNRNARKTAIDIVRAKTEDAKVNGKNKVILSESECNLVTQKMQNQTWKDEFVTVIIFGPFITVLIGSVASAFGNDKILDSAAIMFQSIDSMGIEYALLLKMTVVGALGMRLWRG